MDGQQDRHHLEQHLSTISTSDPKYREDPASNTDANANAHRNVSLSLNERSAPAANSLLDLATNSAQPSISRVTRGKKRHFDTDVAGASSSQHLKPRRSTRNSLGGPTVELDSGAASSSASGKGKKKVQIEETGADNNRESAATDRKGKKRASKSPSPLSDPPPLKRPRRSSGASTVRPTRYGLRSKVDEAISLQEAGPSASDSKGKGKAKAKTPVKGKKSIINMPKKVAPKPRKSGPSGTERSKKGDSTAKQLVDNDMDADWVDEPSGSGIGGMDEEHNDENMDGSDHEDDEDEEGSDDEDEPPFRPGGAGGSANPYGRLAHLAGGGGLNLDEATAAALFGGEFRAFGGMMSGMTSRFKRLKSELKSSSSTTRLSALRECSETLLIANEDTLGGAFSINSFATEFIAILNGKPNIDPDAPTEVHRQPDEMDEDAQLAAALAMSTGGEMPSGMGNNEDEMESQLVACRCLAHLMEALPGSGHTLVHLGAVPVLCSKLTEISYIELAEQTLQTMEKISAEYPSAIVKEGGLGALLNYLPFFSTNVQRTAVTAAANCCRNISSEHYNMIKDVFPTLRDTLSQGDQRLVEQATLAVVRTIEAYRYNAEHLEGLLDLPTVAAINSLLMPSGGSPLLTPSTYTHLLRVLTTSARGSAKVTIAFLEAGMTNTVYQILTGVLPPASDEAEPGASEEGQGLSGGVADMAVLQNLTHRPKDQVEEALALICELLPPTPRDGVFDARYYTEKALAKVKKSKRPERTSRRKSKADTSDPAASAGPSTPIAASASLPVATDVTPSATIANAATKAKKDAEQALEQRLELLNAHPELIGKFIKAIVPVLVDVYAASVAIRVRTKVLMGLVKAVAFADAEALKSTLHSVPMASFLGAIISSKDNPFFVLCALQLVELLATKLADIYQSSFLREGVAYEIEQMAKQDLSTAKAAQSDKESTEVKTEPNDSSTGAGPSTAPAAAPALPPMPPIPDDLKPLLPAGYQSLFALEPVAGPSTPKKNPVTTAEDANIIRARVIVAKKVFAAGGDDQHEATSVLNKLQEMVTKLCLPDAKEADLRDTLREAAEQFAGSGPALSSFELLKSGLVDGLLEFVDIDGTVSSAQRRAILFEAFTASSGPTGTALFMLVKRLHESLGRLETFEVETAFGGSSDPARPSSSLSRTIRVRLQAEEGQDIPKQVSALSVTIQAIAPLQQVHDWIRPRVADANYASGGLSGILAAYAASGLSAGRGGAGSASRLLSALAGAGIHGGLGDTPTSTQQPQLATSAPESSSRLALPPPVNATPPSKTTGAGETSPKVTRRRSARLSAQGTGNETSTAATEAPATATPAAAALSSSAPEPSILPAMPVDMDFDEEYSDEEYDAEVYEEDMEEEIIRPVEKVVNMSLAPDGSRVEAKTPDGTRVETPNQVSIATAPAASASGMATPTRTGSYAGAVKTAPADWHLEFTLNGTTLSLEDTLYGAVHKYANKAVGASMSSYSNMVTIMFKKVDGPAPTKASAAVDAPSPASMASVLPSTLEPSAPTTKILRLLRVVHNLSVEARDLNSRDETVLEESLFVNNKLTAKLTRQLEETMILASDCLPVWATELPRHFAFLFPFETRYSFLQSTSFGYGRLISRHQSSQPTNRNIHRRDDLSHLARIPRQKVRISRAQLLESCAKVLELYGTSNGILEVEYFDEIGTGLGPTLEFYSLASKGFAKRSLELWRDEDESKVGEYVFHPNGLFPAPLAPPTNGAAIDAHVSWFKTLGTFIGRALLDSRIIDVNLNKVMLKLLLGQTVKKNVATLKLVDIQLARSLERLQVYLQARKEIEALKLPASTRRNKLLALTVNGAKLGDMSLDFTLPGYNIELKPGGAMIDVDDTNLEEYLERVLEMTLGSGIERQIKAFQEGFSMIFPIEDLKIFSAPELGLLFGNADEDWSRETLEHAIKADHGYNLDSRAVQNLIEVMAEYDKDRRRNFLQFITGAPKLPIGGFRGLNPPFTVVRKPHEAPFKADDYLPSVMTCAQYLKMPDYTTKEILAAQLGRAMQDGGGSFHLS